MVSFFDRCILQLRAMIPAELLIPATVVVYRDGVAENQIEVTPCPPTSAVNDQDLTTHLALYLADVPIYLAGRQEGRG